GRDGAPAGTADGGGRAGPGDGEAGPGRQGPLTGCGTPPVPAATLEPAGGAARPPPAPRTDRC
ncbi:serine/threonine protein kinase, partial [Streptomyces violaceoruber]